MTKHQICLASSQEFYSGLSLAIRDPHLSIIEVDMSGIRHLYPWQLTLAACLNVWSQERARLHFHWNQAKDFQNDIVSYAKQVGLFADLREDIEGIQSLNSFSFNPENYFELQRIEGGSHEVSRQQLKRLLARFPAVGEKLSDCLNDLSQNIFEHSGPRENTGWGFVQAQTTSGKLRISYCDFGVGCYKTFQRNNLLQGRGPREILETCLEPQGSCLAHTGAHWHRGLGLSRICDFLTNNRGSMDIISDGLRCRYSNGKKSTQLLGTRTKGTLISIEIPFSRKVHDSLGLQACKAQRLKSGG